MDNFPSWITRKFVEWQASEGKRKTIEEFAAYLGTSRPLVNMWMNGNKKPGKENINILAEIFGNEIYDVLEIPRPNPYLQNQYQLDGERASLAAQLGLVRKSITNLTNAISESGHSAALLKKLSANEALEVEIRSKLEKLKAQTHPAIIIPTEDQARAAAHRISIDLKSKDRAFVRQTLLGTIHEINTVREGNHIHGMITFFHSPIKTVSLSSSPVGAPIYRHSIPFEGIISPNRKPVI